MIAEIKIDGFMFDKLVLYMHNNNVNTMEEAISVILDEYFMIRPQIEEQPRKTIENQTAEDILK